MSRKALLPWGCIVLVLCGAIFWLHSARAAESASRDDFEASLRRILQVDATAPVASPAFKQQVLAKLRQTGDCGRILQDLFARATAEDRYTEVNAYGNYLTITWGGGERDGVLRRLELMIGFDKEWKPISATAAIKDHPFPRPRADHSAPKPPDVGVFTIPDESVNEKKKN